MDISNSDGDDDEDDTVSLDESFFVNRAYELSTHTFGPHALRLYSLPSASTDYDLTGQLIWPGAVLLNSYLSANPTILDNQSVIELGSGVGITGILCSKYSSNHIVLTDHNDEVLDVIKKNIDLQSPSSNLSAEKLKWGNGDQLKAITAKHPAGFDLVIGADICFQQASVPLLFATVADIFRLRGGRCRFILGYVSRAKVMDTMVVDEAAKRGMRIEEVEGTRTILANLEGVVYEISIL